MTSSVTVVIPSYPRGLVGRAIASVQAQTVPCRMLVTESPKDDWWNAKINDAVASTSTEWIAILCDDDELCPTFVEEMLAASEGVDLVMCARRIVNPTDPILAAWFRVTSHIEVAHPLTVESMVRGCPCAMTCLIRRSAWDALGGYRGAMTYSDWDFSIRFAAQGLPWRIIPQPLWLYHEHTTNGALVLDHDAALLQLQAAHPQLPWLAKDEPRPIEQVA